MGGVNEVAAADIKLHSRITNYTQRFFVSVLVGRMGRDRGIAYIMDAVPGPREIDGYERERKTMVDIELVFVFVFCLFLFLLDSRFLVEIPIRCGARCAFGAPVKYKNESNTYRFCEKPTNLFI